MSSEFPRPIRERTPAHISTELSLLSYQVALDDARVARDSDTSAPSPALLQRLARNRARLRELSART
ncbi:MAG: hypothetical protein ACRET5_17430 [Steroidobacteraceae bacterium]